MWDDCRAIQDERGEGWLASMQDHPFLALEAMCILHANATTSNFHSHFHNQLIINNLKVNGFLIMGEILAEVGSCI